MNLYISTTFIDDGCSLYDALKICDENKISSIEIGSNHSYEDDYSYISDFNMNFLIHNYFPVPKNSLVINIASLNAEIRKEVLIKLKGLLSIAQILEHPCLLFMLGLSQIRWGQINQNQIMIFSGTSLKY